jgi:hypothetical protein
VEAAQATLDHFRGRPFVWGESDCARLAAHVLRGLGYKPNLSQFGSYRSDRAALRALKARGMASVIDWMDSVPGLSRIAPAAALPGDIIAFPGGGGWDGLAVAIGNGRVLAFTETVAGNGCAVLAANLEAAVAAWSAPPCPIS